jgi:hypothetical protein
MIKNGVFALADCNDKGSLNKKFVIVEAITDSQVSTYVCSCDDVLRRSKFTALDEGRLNLCDSNAHCVHIEETIKLFSDSLSTSVDNDDSIVRLTSKLLASYCDNTRTYGILTEGPRSMKCLTCNTKVTSCVHMRAYKNNAMDHGFDPSSRKVAEEFSCISSAPISYPLDDDDAHKFTMYATGSWQYPDHLVPSDVSMTCEHGNGFDRRDPIEQQWILHKDAVIHTKLASIPCVTFYRPSLGDCSCYRSYDGASDLLLNLDNKHLFSYLWVYDILHDTQETRYPLAAAFRSANRTRTTCGLGPLGAHCYNYLRVAYNCFLRLLDLDFTHLFDCDICGKDVDCVIMDGIMMGSRQDLVPNYDTSTPASTAVIPECSIADRVFLVNVASRKKLATYAGLCRIASWKV